jgi:hypothetical protein
VADFIYDDIYLKDEPPYFEGIIKGKKVPINIGIVSRRVE